MFVVNKHLHAVVRKEREFHIGIADLKIPLPLDTEIIGGKLFGTCKTPIEDERFIRLRIDGLSRTVLIGVIAAEQAVSRNASVGISEESLVKTRTDVRFVDRSDDNSVAEQVFVVPGSLHVLRIHNIETAQNGKPRKRILRRKRIIGGHKIVLHTDVFFGYLFRRVPEEPGHSTDLTAIHLMRAVYARDRAECAVLNPARIHIVRH